MHYNRFRYYDPELGRYISADPIGQGDGLNVFAYVRGNPVNRMDTLGLASCEYSISSHTLNCTSDSGDSASIGPDGVFSGNGECRNNPECADKPDSGPIPPGEYEMVPSSKYGGSYWLDEGKGKRLLAKLGFGRSEFFLHKGTISNGCITVDESNDDDFGAAGNVLSDESSDTLTVVP